MLIRALVLTVAVATLAGCASRPQPVDNRNVLWRIVSECLEATSPNYCSACPSPLAGACTGVDSCERTTQVWAETDRFVAIRDLKMCGCPVTFVHGLALPRWRVTGVEDPRRPEDIWPFAWAVAKSRIPDESSIALVVNPPADRTQDQMHVHLVRLLPDARPRIAARSPVPTPKLDRVWDVALRRAAATGLLSYGVLVARDDKNEGYLVLVTPGSPEFEFTASECRTSS